MVQGSINIPFMTAFSPEGELCPCPAVTTLNSRRSQVIVVVGNRGRNASNVSYNRIKKLKAFIRNYQFIYVCTNILFRNAVCPWFKTQSFMLSKSTKAFKYHSVIHTTTNQLDKCSLFQYRTLKCLYRSWNLKVLL